MTVEIFSHATATSLYRCIMLSDINNIFIQITLKITTLLEN